MERRGYIYVLATAYQNGEGQQIIKIGRTSRSPASRVKELSRGGPSGMTLVGSVPCRDTVELEKRAHQHFHHARFRSDGGTEYFTALADDVLSWLRTETPRFDLESARKDAWVEYTKSRPFIIQSRLSMLIIIPGILSPLAGFLIQPLHFWSILIGPVVFVALMLMVLPTIQRLSYMRKLREDLQLVQRELESKYHIPIGSIKF